MRNMIAYALVRLATRLSPDVKFEPTPKYPVNALERATHLMQRLNNTLHQCPPFKLTVFTQWGRQQVAISLIPKKGSPNG